MQEIKCPKCGEVFQVDESGYAAIVKQVRDKEFEKEISAREKAYMQQKDNAVEMAATRTEAEKTGLLHSFAHSWKKKQQTTKWK